MASIGAVAIKRGAATTRLISAMSTIARELGVAPAALPTARDVTFEHAAQLEALAEWAEGVADALDPKSEASNSLLKDYNKRQKAALDKTADYDAMTRADVLKLAEAVGMPVTAKTTKLEAVDWLQAAAGMSEDEAVDFLMAIEGVSEDDAAAEG